MTRSPAELTELSNSLEQRVRRSIARAKTISERYEDAPDLTGHIEELETALPLTIEIGVNAKEIPKIQKKKAETLVLLVQGAITDLNNVLSDYFRNKARLEESEEDLDEGIDVDAIFPEAEEMDNDTKRRIARAVANAINRKKHRRKNPKGTKVKRLPPWETDISGIAALIGEERLASELTEEHPKPLFADLEKDKDTGVVRRKRIFTETPNNDVQSALEEFGRFVEEEDRRHAAEDKYPLPPCQPTYRKVRKTVLSTVEELERRVGVCTSEKLAAERKLTLYKHALAEANEELLKCKVKELVKATDFEFDNMKEDFEEALRERRF